MVSLKLMHSLTPCLMGVVGVLVSWGPAKGFAPGEPEKEAMGRAAVVAYGANMRAFSFYTCRYRFTKAQVKSVEDAIAGKFVNARSFENRLIIDGEKVLYEGLAPPDPPDTKQAKAVPGKPGLFMTEAFAISDRYLAGDKGEMNYTPQMKTLGLWDRQKNTLGVAHSPLGYLRHNCKNGPETFAAQQERYELAAVGLEEVEGRPVITVRFNDREVLDFEPPLRIAESFSFDGGRGHVPIRITTFWNDKPQSRYYVTNLRECSNQRWFPERIVVVDTPSTPDGLFTVSEIQVLELDADRRPSRDAFALSIPAGTLVNESTGNDARRYFVLKQDEKLSIDDLPTLFSMLDNVKDNPLMDTDIQVHRTNSWWHWLGAAVGLTLVLGGAAYLVRRRRRFG
jgi:hypothetical protein